MDNLGNLRLIQEAENLEFIIVEAKLVKDWLIPSTLKEVIIFSSSAAIVLTFDQ